MLVGETKSKSWERQDVKHSYENLESSLKNNLEKHIKSFDNYSGKNNLKIYLIDYKDFGIEMCENIESNPKYFAKNRKEPQYFNNYRLSKDKKILDYLYQHKDKIDYVIMNYYDFCEVIKISKPFPPELLAECENLTPEELAKPELIDYFKYKLKALSK